jgi:hypothetical protein
LPPYDFLSREVSVFDPPAHSSAPGAVSRSLILLLAIYGAGPFLVVAGRCFARDWFLRASFSYLPPKALPARGVGFALVFLLCF